MSTYNDHIHRTHIRRSKEDHHFSRQSLSWRLTAILSATDYVLPTPAPRIPLLD